MLRIPSGFGTGENSLDIFEEWVQLALAFENQQIEYALCGGLAMAVYAFPRATFDIDILIQPEMLDQAKRVAKSLGFSFETGIMSFKEGAIQMARLTKVDPDSEDALSLDMLLVTPQIKTVWETRQQLPWEEGKIPVVSPEGLIQLKLMRGSGQDQDDIQRLREMINGC